MIVAEKTKDLVLGMASLEKARLGGVTTAVVKTVATATAAMT
jgi:hypothetical protein